MSQNITGAIKDLIDLGKHFGFVDRQTDRNNGLMDVLDELRLSSGIGDEVLVNDMETTADWTESTSGELDVASEGTIIKVGTYSQKFTSTTADSGNVSTDVIDAGDVPATNPFTNRAEMNWDNSDWLVFWAATGGSNHFATAGDMLLNIQNYGNPSDGVADWGTAVNVPANAHYDNTNPIWKSNAIEITSFERDRVEKIRFENNEPTGSQSIYIDEIIRCKFIDGKGPLRGPCIPVVAKSAEAILIGNIVRYDTTTRRAINWVTSVNANDVGPCAIPGTGNAAGTVLVWVVHRGLARMRTAASSGIAAAGDAIMGGSVNTIVDTTNAAAEKTSFGKACEAPAEDSTGNHDIDVQIGLVSEGFTS